MDNYSIKELEESEFPELLKEIPDPPKKLFLAGNLPSPENKILCVVGSRKYTEYGKEVVETLINGLKNYPITIVSGLALGIDSVAHRAALKNNLQTIAVPGSGLNPKNIYPSTHLQLAREIVKSGGGLMSEFENDFKATLWSFPQRNRIMAGMSHAVLVVEAEIKSGTLITSRLATEYNRDVFAIPGSIFSKNSAGPNMLIKLGATPVDNVADILKVLGLENSIQEEQKINRGDFNKEELIIIDILNEPKAKEDVIIESGMSASQVNMILSVMEIKGVITESMGEIRLK